MLVAADYSMATLREIVIAGGLDDPATLTFLQTIRSRFMPYTIVLVVDSEETRRKLAPLFPGIAEMHPIDRKPTAFVCEDYACKLPTNDVSKFGELLQ